MSARIRAARRIGVGDMAGLDAQLMVAVRGLDERLLAVVSFRLRLLRMALQRLDRIPAPVVMALEAQDYEARVLFDPDTRAARIGSVSKSAHTESPAR